MMKPPPTPPSSDGPDIRLHVLDTGLIEMTEYSLFSPSAGPNVHYEMPVRSYVVVHPGGTIVWDTGIDDAVHAEGGRQIFDPIRFQVPKTMRSQLDELGIDPAEVAFLALSHLHPDHVGNVDLFPETTVLLQQAEVGAAFGPKAEELTYMPDYYAALNRQRRRGRGRA